MLAMPGAGSQRRLPGSNTRRKNEKGKGFQRRRGVAIDASALQHGYQGSMARQGRKVWRRQRPCVKRRKGRSRAGRRIREAFRSPPSHVYASFQVLTLGKGMRGSRESSAG